MTNDIRLSVSGDTQALVDAVKKGALAVEDLKDVLDDSGDAGKDAGRDIERGMKDAQRDTKELKDDIKTATDAFEKAGRAGRDIGDNVKYGTDKAADGMSDFKQEAGQSARETAASIKSVEDGLGAIQETAANALVGFGPAGAAAGLVAAVGLGLVSTELDAQKQKAEELKTGLVNAYLDASLAGRNFLTEEETIAAARAVIEKDDEASRAKRLKDAETLGVTTSTLILAESGDRKALSEIEDVIARKRSDADADARANGEAGRDRASEESIALDIIAEDWKKVRDAITEATAKGEELSDVQVEQKRKTTDAQNAMIGGYASAVLAAQSAKDAVNNIPSSRTITLNVDTSKANREIESFLSVKRTLGINLQTNGKLGNLVR